MYPAFHFVLSCALVSDCELALEFKSLVDDRDLERDRSKQASPRIFRTIARSWYM